MLVYIKPKHTSSRKSSIYWINDYFSALCLAFDDSWIYIEVFLGRVNTRSNILCTCTTLKEVCFDKSLNASFKTCDLSFHFFDEQMK